MPVGSGPTHLIEPLPAYILYSSPKLNPSLTRNSEVITHFSTIDTIKYFFILPYVFRSFTSRWLFNFLIVYWAYVVNCQSKTLGPYYIMKSSHMITRQRKNHSSLGYIPRYLKLNSYQVVMVVQDGTPEQSRRPALTILWKPQPIDLRIFTRI